MRPPRSHIHSVPRPPGRSPPTEVDRLTEAVDRWFLVYVRDLNLFPVTLALFAHVSLLITGLLLGVWRSASWVAAGSLLALAVATVVLAAVEARQFGWGGRTALLLAGTWAAAVGLAWYAEQTGIL